ncbi:hypothetical protein KKF17_03510 [Patescibacteria group bacterium]|nr:hypothetical protein [Patescibacteria group bacterium]
MKNYKDLYKPIQVYALDLEGVDFKEDTINSVIDIILLELTDKYSKVSEGIENYINPIPTDNDLLWIIYNSALILLAPSGGELSYKTAAVSIKKGAAEQEQIVWLKEKIYRVETPDLISSDSDFEMVYQGADRMAKMIENLT